ncbi:MAG: hypothetical protein V8S72_05270 [Oscillospiraceae bacterium]
MPMRELVNIALKVLALLGVRDLHLDAAAALHAEGLIHRRDLILVEVCADDRAGHPVIRVRGDTHRRYQHDGQQQCGYSSEFLHNNIILS